MYKILLADDEELERQVLGFTLRNSGLPVEISGEAANGQEALDQAQRLKPDLIIMDIKMPGLDGIEATRQIKTLFPATEVIILTAYGRFSYSQQAIKAQASDYLLKPIQPEQLIRAVELALDRLSHKRFQLAPAVDFTGLEDQVKVGHLEGAKQNLSLLLENLNDNGMNPSTARLNSFAWRLLVIVVQVALSMGADSTKVTAFEDDRVKELPKISSLEEMKLWGEVTLEKCIRLLDANQQADDQAQVQKIMDYIECNYAQDITLNLVATYVHFSPAYLSRIFTKKTGIGFTQYLTQVRLKKAQQKLRMSAETIDQIAAATGFSSSSYFSAVFKRHVGITPSEYRANHN